MPFPLVLARQPRPIGQYITAAAVIPSTAAHLSVTTDLDAAQWTSGDWHVSLEIQRSVDGARTWTAFAKAEGGPHPQALASPFLGVDLVQTFKRHDHRTMRGLEGGHVRIVLTVTRGVFDAGLIAALEHSTTDAIAAARMRRAKLAG